MTPTARALLATVRAKPRDTTARMVYADALQDAGDEAGAHLQRAIAEPDNDGHRLALADALERMAGTVKCRLCKGEYDEIRGVYGCKACHGTGRVSDGRKEWSEFIRVQVRIHYLKSAEGGKHANHSEASKNCHLCYEVEQGVRREHELWGYLPSRNGVRSLFESTLPGAAFCTATDGGKHLGRGFPIVLIQRGLPSIARCTLAEWMGRTCGACEDGRLYHGSNGNPWSETCDICHGSNRIGGIGPQLAQAWPIVEVQVTDAVIHPSGGNSTYYVGGLGIFPKEFWRRLEGHRTPSAARAALSDALISYARSQTI